MTTALRAPTLASFVAVASALEGDVASAEPDVEGPTRMSAFSRDGGESATCTHFA